MPATRTQRWTTARGAASITATAKSEPIDTSSASKSDSQSKGPQAADTDTKEDVLPHKSCTRRSYPVRKTEQGVFTTPPYSEYIKPFWRFKDEGTARESAEKIWSIFEAYRSERDFVGMDMARKFLQMGRTRSLRYALRKGGKKYDAKNGHREIPRTGEVYDEGKLKGAGIFEGYWARCWDDEVYLRLWEEWGGSKVKPKRGGVGEKGVKEEHRDEETHEQLESKREVKVKEE